MGRLRNGTPRKPPVPGRSTLVACAVLVACGAPGDQAGVDAPTEEEVTAHNTLTAQEEADGWMLLFDGVSTEGWRGYGRDGMPPGGWSVENGELVGHASGGDMEGGDIVTVGEFTDFDLVFDFKVGPEGNSGVFYRVQEHQGAGLWQVAAEYQVLDDPAYIAMGTMDMAKHLTGENYDLHGTSEKTMHPTGEWNTGRIRVEGNHVTHWLNGQITVEFEMYTDAWEALVAASKFGCRGALRACALGLDRPAGPRDPGVVPEHEDPPARRSTLMPAASARTVVALLGLALQSPLVLHAQESVPIFNGTDLDGWTVHGTELWYVEDGELVCESGPDEAYGYLRTNATYTDFELTLEFKQEADGNSGVFFRSTLDGVIVTGWQAEVAPPGLFSGGIYESYGRGWLVQPDPAKDAALRMGEWNEMRVRVVGDRVTTWINGTEMIDLVDAEIGEATGHIALQIHDGGGIKVRWRNLRVLEL